MSNVPAGFIVAPVTGCIIPEHEAEAHAAAYRSRIARHAPPAPESIAGVTAAAAEELSKVKALREELQAQVEAGRAALVEAKAPAKAKK